MGRASEIRIVDPVLTNLAWGYKNAAMVASALFPRVPVEKEGLKIPIFGKEAFKEYNTLRALRGNTNIMPVDAESTTAVVLDEHDLAYPIDKREKRDSTCDRQRIGLQRVQGAMALRHEIQCATIACARIQSSMKGVLPLDVMKELFGIENIFVGDAIKSSDAGVLSKVWSDFVVLAYVALGSESNEEPSYGYDLGLKGYPQVDTYETQGGKVENVRITDIHKPVMVSAAAGYLISDALA